MRSQVSNGRKRALRSKIDKTPHSAGVLLRERLLSEAFYQFSYAEPFFFRLTLGYACGGVSSACLSLVDSVLPHWGGLETPLTCI